LKLRVQRYVVVVSVVVVVDEVVSVVVGEVVSVLVVVGEVVPEVVVAGAVAFDADAKIIIVFIHIRLAKYLLNSMISKFKMQ
jgi:hypothetical protein